MTFRQRMMMGLALSMAASAAHAVPVSFQFVVEAPGSFAWSGPEEAFPPEPVPAELAVALQQPIVGSFTFETISPFTLGYLPNEGQLVEVGATYINPVSLFNVQLGDQTLSFTTAAPSPDVYESSISVVDLPPQLTQYPADFYSLSVFMGTGLIPGFENYRVGASLTLTESDLTRIASYDPLQPLLLSDAPWNFSFALYNPATDISYSIFSPVTQLAQVTQVPEPGTSALLAIGVLCWFVLGAGRRMTHLGGQTPMYQRTQ